MFHTSGKMESLVYKNTCCNVIQEENCVIGSELCTSMRKEARSLLDIGGNDWEFRVVDSSRLKTLKCIHACKSVHKLKRCPILSQFHTFQTQVVHTAQNGNVLDLTNSSAYHKSLGPLQMIVLQLCLQ